MSFYVKINRKYFEKILEMSSEIYAPEEVEKALNEHLWKEGFALDKNYPVPAIKESEGNTLFFVSDDNKNLNWHNKIEFLFAG